MFLLPDAEVELNSILIFKGILFGEADYSYLQLDWNSIRKL